MIPVVQFDPASLAIFAELPTMAVDNKLAEVIEAVMSGDVVEFSNKLGQLSAHPGYGRALQVSSAFLHEKRHFHDFISTNYGAYRFRQFQEIYANLRTILKTGQELEQLFLPLEINLDSVRRKVLEIGNVPEAILEIANVLKNRRRMIAHDRKPYSSRLGTFEIGGEAQLESLAYLAQSRFVTVFGGVDAHDKFSDHIYDREQFQAKYGAFVNIGLAAGVLPVRHLEPLTDCNDGITHRAYLDSALLECAIFAALQTDYVTQPEDVRHGILAMSYPAERFAAIVAELTKNYRSLCETTSGLNWGECWEAVDTTCAGLFGLRVHEQIQRDIESQESVLRILRRSNDEVVVGISEDFLELRKTMCEKLKLTPAFVASTEYFAASVGSGVNPINVIVSSRGELGDPPQGYTRLMGYDTSKEGGGNRPWRKWWWAAAEEPGTFATKSDALGFPRPHLFYSVIDSYAPIAKLMLNGRRVRTLIGPELLFAEKRLASEAGVTIGFFPGFEFPDDEIPEPMLRFLKPDGQLICDYCNETIPKGSATILSPWTLRRYPELAKHMIEHMKGGTTDTHADIAYHTFVRDWSHWSLSNDVMGRLSRLMVL